MALFSKQNKEAFIKPLNGDNPIPVSYTHLVVGSGCLYVDARSVISPFALSDLRIYLERIVDGVQAHLGTQSQLADKVVRLHVLANSDSEEDQALKLKVRDAVLEQATETLRGADSQAEARDVYKRQR